MTLQMGAVCRAIAGQPSGQPKESLNAAARKTLNLERYIKSSVIKENMNSWQVDACNAFLLHNITPIDNDGGLNNFMWQCHELDFYGKTMQIII